MLTEVGKETPGQGLPQWKIDLPNRPLTGLTVLVVEDSRFASEAVRLLCLRSGARIRRADCLRSAARHLQTYRPSVVIVDLGLPDGNGADLIRRMVVAHPRVPVILGMSGDPDNEQAAMEAGANGFLAKPVESLAAFQQMVLRHLPAAVRLGGPRLLTDDVIAPDATALRDDLLHIVEVMAAAENTGAVDYIAGFLAGLGRSAHDTALEDAANLLARDHADGRSLAADLTRISGLVYERLAAAKGI
ncbi:response regulator [Paracoccus zhejiangensis]|uniref:Response regulator n=1 Tax=Paracoccus zhejiangensis TaxID=1077935 RepID=A0A2H5F3U1_9RHOB|nr:response regulator [Paracoccus zhejiangensis]AUH66213.1 response regulator [Paracoccus zhejiangensis]